MTPLCIIFVQYCIGARVIVHHDDHFTFFLNNRRMKPTLFCMFYLTGHPPRPRVYLETPIDNISQGSENLINLHIKQHI